MDPIESELKEALKSTAPTPPAQTGALTHRITANYRRKQKAAGQLLSGYLLGLIVALAILFWGFFQAQDFKQSLLIAVLILITFQSTVLMKLWYWIIHERIATVREIKLLQLLVAERLPQVPGEPEPAGEVPSSEEAELTSKRKRWGWALAALLWIGAVAGLAGTALLWPEDGLKNAELYFEATGQPAPGEEIVETFRVERSKPRFHPGIFPERGHAEVWIALGPEDGPVSYQGPVTDSSRIYFGSPLEAGSYTIRYKVIQADAPFRLRVFGADLPKSGMTSRDFWMMLCGAIAAAIPLAWLQARWLRRVDPELIA